MKKGFNLMIVLMTGAFLIAGLATVPAISGQDSSCGTCPYTSATTKTAEIKSDSSKTAGSCPVFSKDSTTNAAMVENVDYTKSACSSKDVKSASAPKKGDLTQVAYSPKKACDTKECPASECDKAATCEKAANCDKAATCDKSAADCAKCDLTTAEKTAEKSDILVVADTTGSKAKEAPVKTEQTVEVEMAGSCCEMQ